MIGLAGHRPELKLMQVVGGAVRKFTVPQLEEMSAKHRQAGVEDLKHEGFLLTER
jgi:hypothetical protein